MGKRKEERIGQKKMMNNGQVAEIIQYDGALDITVKFDNGYTTNAQYQQFLDGKIRNPFSTTVAGIGYIGDVDEVIYKNGKTLNSYQCWYNMLMRCYDKETQKLHPSYIGIKVCDEWKCYANFKKFYNDNYYEIEGEIVDLDKDILVRGNKIYSPETCIFVPRKLNGMLKGNTILDNYLKSKLKDIAELYKNYISEKLYNCLISYAN